MFGRFSRLIASTGLLLGSLAIFAGAAQAHATLVRCNGLHAGQVLTAVPTVLTCTFAEGVNPKNSFMGIFEATGDHAEVDKENSAVSFSNAHQMTVSVPKLAKGKYTFIWYTISADDGHRAGGAFPFTIK